MANSIGMRMNGFTGRGRSGSRNRNMIAPSTVRKKKAYSARPLRVSKMRMFPSRMYTAERIVLSMRALLAGVSDGWLDVTGLRTLATLHRP